MRTIEINHPNVMVSHSNILVVSGDDALREKLTSLLSPDEFSEAINAQQALESIRGDQSQLAFIDAHLPDMEGMELLKVLTKNFRNIYCVSVIGAAEEKLIPSSFRAGAKDFLRKPVEIEAFAQVLSSYRAFIAQTQSRALELEGVQNGKLNLTLESTAAAISQALGMISQLLRPFVEDALRKRLELALDEALRNAYEHGNLGVTENQKIAFCEAGTFELELEKRSRVAQEAGKTTRVEIEINENHFVCTITDDGEGYDWAQHLRARQMPAGPNRTSGRGLYVIQQFFEKITYNDIGNQIRLEKSL